MLEITHIPERFDVYVERFKYPGAFEDQPFTDGVFRHEVRDFVFGRGGTLRNWCMGEIDDYIIAEFAFRHDAEDLIEFMQQFAGE